MFSLYGKLQKNGLIIIIYEKNISHIKYFENFNFYEVQF